VARDHSGFRPSQADPHPVLAGPGGSDCFADEIAIDFPSVDRLVSRVRDRFLGLPPEADLITVHVRVSPSEAHRGARVPLHVPLRDLCSHCGGRGEVWSESCPGCHGAGHRIQRYPVRVWVPAGVTDGTRFRLRVSSPAAQPRHVEVSVTVSDPHV